MILVLALNLFVIAFPLVVGISLSIASLTLPTRIEPENSDGWNTRELDIAAAFTHPHLSGGVRF